MKKFVLPFALLSSMLLFSCATTNAVPEATVEAEVTKSEETRNIVETNDKTVEDVETKTTDELNQDIPINQEPDQIEEDLEPEITEPEEETIEVFETVGLTKKVASLESAEKIANFKMDAPKTFAVYKSSEYSVQDDYKISVTYKNTKNAEESFVVRKAVGNLDVSEDFKKYSFTKIFVENGTRVVAKGSEDGLYTLATWTGNDFTYSMESNTGFPKEVIFALVGEVN